jgi:2,5-diketo-D-gluconate reductase B
MEADLPQIGLGTYSDSNREQWRDTIPTALELGYRHVDTAEVYRNERYIARGIGTAEADREEIFLATKIVNPHTPSAPESVPQLVENRLDCLETDYLDLVYVHWPLGEYDPEATLPRVEEMRDRGHIRHVGVSNFTPPQLDAAREALDGSLFAHQAEMHPLLPQESLVEYAQQHDHWLVAHTPLANGRITEVPEVRSIAAKHDATPAQVGLAWVVSHDNVVAIPKSASIEHLRENIAAPRLELDAADYRAIDAIDRRHRVVGSEHFD